MTKLVILLGTNMGDKKGNLRDALAALERSLGNITARSEVYRTQPWGDSEQEDYYNMSVCVETEHAAPQAMNIILELERELGRVRSGVPNQPRIIDIDILFYDDLVLHQHDLTIPHPRLHERRFTLVPLAEMIPHFKHPVLHQTMETLLENCEDPLTVEPVGTL